MKIGILTYHRAHNYGALLQAFALKTHLTNLGHNVNFVDYWPTYHGEEYQLIPFFKNRSIFGKIKSIIFLIFGFSRIIRRRHGYLQFIRQKLCLDDNPQFRTEIELTRVDYDVVIYGSDQIWRRSNSPNNNGFSDVYFGAFPKNVKHKVSYAASMGVVDINSQDKQYIKRMLKNFNAISVREEGLKKYIDELTPQSVALVLDPVFLLSKNDWSALISNMKRVTDEKYILFYHLTRSTEANSFVNYLNKRYQYRVIEIRGVVEPLLIGKRYFQTANPYDFVTLIQNAEIVVSTSFHGVAFSLIFEKQFYAFCANENSERIKSLLDNLGVSDRFISNNNTGVIDNLIQYKIVNDKIASLRKESHQFLNSNLVQFTD